MHREVVLLAAVSMVYATSAWSQTIYQSRDKNGVPVYTDRLPADGKVEKTFVYEYLPSSPVSAPPVDSRNGQGSQHHVSGNASGSSSIPTNATNVTLYGASWCPYCRGARTYLAQRGIAFQEVDIDTPSGRYAYDMAGGRSGVPLLIVGNRRVQGFSKKGYDALFANK